MLADIGSEQSFLHDPDSRAIRVGFVPLIDAAPFIAAAELGFFADEGLNVRLDPQIGWGNVRDRLTYGQLDASHAPLGMVPASLTGKDFYEEPLAMLMGLGAGGNAITVAKSLAELGDGPMAPAAWRQSLHRPLSLAYVFSYASHHYFLRELLQTAGLNAEHDASLRVLPPPQMPELLKSGTIDGFCAGEPWNTLAEMRGYGTIIRATTELAPDHPEKVLAVTRKWYRHNEQAAERLVRATVRGCDYCDNPANHGQLADLLAQPQYLDVERDVIARSLAIDTWLRPAVKRQRFRTFGRPATEPRPQHVAWVLRQMIRWGYLPANTDIDTVARASVIPEPYRRADAALSKTHPTLVSLEPS